MLVNFAYNPHLVGKPPKDIPYVAHRAMWRWINGGFINKRGRPETLAKLIASGHPYTQTHVRYRHQRNFVQGQVISLDFDDNGAFGRILEDEFIAKYAYFLYSTPSSTPQSPRSRAVFILPKPITNPVLFAAMQRALVVKYSGFADRSCKDPLRLFFGSSGCDIYWVKNTLPINVIQNMAEELLEKEHQEEQVVACVSVSDGTIKSELERQLSRIMSATNGHKHEIRLKVGTIIGGYVASGYIPYHEAQAQLLQAAASNTSAPRLAEQDVLDGLSYGMSHPLEIKPTSFADYGIII